MPKRAFGDSPIKKRKVNQIIFLGDFINGGIAKVLAESPIPIFAIWGNNDGDKTMVTKMSLSENSNLTMSENIYDRFLRPAVSAAGFLPLVSDKIFSKP